MFITGLIASLAILFLLFKLPIRKLLWQDALIDVLATIALMVMFAGTFSGMMAAVVGGCIISITLFAAKRVIGYDKPVRRGFRFHWQRIEPRRRESDGMV
jgi:nicotinamide riboside transporter PnuC